MAYLVSVANSELNPLKNEPSGQAHNRCLPWAGGCGGSGSGGGVSAGAAPLNHSNLRGNCHHQYPPTHAHASTHHCPLPLLPHTPHPHPRSAVKRFALISVITLVNEIFPSYTELQVGTRGIEGGEAWG